MGEIKKWLTIIGIEEDGYSGLSSLAIEKIHQADVIFGGKRHLAMVSDVAAHKIEWAQPFSNSMAEIKANTGENVVVLASGDPQWFGVGSMLARHFSAEITENIPARSSFSLAAAKLNWSLARVQTLTLHGRPFANLARFVAPNTRLLALSNDGKTPKMIADYLLRQGFGQSKVWVMEHLGGEKERIRQSAAAEFDLPDIADLNIVAIDCIGDGQSSWHSLAPGLPDEAFRHDGQLTKSVVRAATLAALKPYSGALLWDVGAGCGSIGIEWMRAAPNARAIAIEPNAARCKMIEENAANLGVPGLQLVRTSAPGCLHKLARPDAIFIGGGLTQNQMFETCWQELSVGGILVANGVTLESDTCLFALQEKYGGTLRRISVEQVAPMGEFRGWKPAKPVTQWRVVKMDKAK